MWLERLCKAHLWRAPEVNHELLFTHGVVAKILPTLILKNAKKAGLQPGFDSQELRELCREIDLLHPQVDDGGRRPDNVEYPWAFAGGVAIAPASWTFPIQAHLYTRTGKSLRKVASWLTMNPQVL
jgi:hypothetical protein